MKKKQFRHLGCKVKIKQTLKHTEVDIVLPNNTRFGKKFLDNRPDKTVPMIDNECFEFQLRQWISDKLEQNNNIDGDSVIATVQ